MVEREILKARGAILLGSNRCLTHDSTGCTLKRPIFRARQKMSDGYYTVLWEGREKEERIA